MKNISKIQYESDPDADRILRESLAAVIGSSTGGGIYAKDIDIINVTEATTSARRRLEEVVTTTDVERRRRLDSSTTKLIIDYSFGVVFEETSFVNGLGASRCLELPRMFANERDFICKGCGDKRALATSQDKRKRFHM